MRALLRAHLAALCPIKPNQTKAVLGGGLPYFRGLTKYQGNSIKPCPERAGETHWLSLSLLRLPAMILKAESKSAELWASK